MSYTINDWKKTIETSNLSKIEKIERMQYVESAFKNKVPIIIDTKHLSKLLGLKIGVLTSMVQSPSSFYREFKIPKKKGGYRDIVTPYKSLLEVQQWIAKHILSCFEIHPSAYAYVKGKNIAQNAKLHIGSSEMLKIDLKDFFPSIKIPRVRELFKRLGYNKEVTYYLSKLCCLKEQLPQGAASSPLISNIILFNLDKRLFKFASNNQLIYSRYADDLVFSGDAIQSDFRILVAMNIQDEGFSLNPDKTIEYSENQRKLITGVVVKKDSIRLPKDLRREIKQQAHYILKFGILDQVKRYNDIFYIDRILGRLSYWKQIEPKNEYVINTSKEIILMYKETMNNIQNNDDGE